jgi:signal transduction histidine kinase
MMPSALLLALTFPHPKRWVRRHPFLVCGLLYGTIPALWLVAGYDHIATIGWVGALVFLLLTAITLGYTFFTTRGMVERAQIRWAVFGLIAAIITLATVVLVGLGVLPSIPGWLGAAIFSLGFIFAFAGFGIAILHYHLYDIDLVINRALVYASLTISVVGIYILIVGYLGMLFQSQGSLGISLAATAVVAILFDYLRRWIQHLVNRLMYGERDDPYGVLAKLGQRLEAAIEPAAALSIAVETVSHALKLPYVAIALKQEDSWKVVAERGVVQSEAARFPLVYAGKSFGDLVAGSRAPGEPLSGGDERLLSDLARQVGVSAHATLLGRELERARLRIVTAREEARRQLGSDLHDGVGHQLAGLARQAERAKDMIVQDPAAAQELIGKISAQLNGAISQVRQLAHQLYPPELELLGLVGAFRERIQANADANLTIRADLPEKLPSLPTAIESVAYYIALEALTNVTKHAGATSCELRLALATDEAGLNPPALALEIFDNGRGLAADDPTGLGLLSMQARAAEVGGLCTIEANPGGGTRVSVRLPCQV